MRKLSMLTGAGAILLMSSVAFAAPCATGTTVKGASDASKSSTVDPKATANASPGAKGGESPGTVGAMNNAGAAATTATSPSDVQQQSQGKPTAAQQASKGGDC